MTTFQNLTNMLETVVKSSNIAVVKYDQDREVLIVEFKRGGTYEYSEVPEAIYEELIQAESVGKTFNEIVRNEFDFRKL